MESWLKIVFPFPGETIDSWLIALAEKRDKELGDPPGFAIFDCVGPGDQGQVLTYYFSPVAASACVGMLETFLPVPCDKPDAKMPGLAVVYGDLVGTSSWDLLK